ncbi:MAG: flagellar basal body rod protein FlgF [Pseudomonadota bacterium]
MDRLIYTAMTGMDAAMNRQRMTANNLANANTPGFRQELFSVTPATIKDPSMDAKGLEARAMARGFVRNVDMSLAQAKPTGQPLDIAVKGEALIAFQAPDGGEIYSRRGDFRVAASGVLENGEGLPVLGETGAPITVPAGFAIKIAEDGSVLGTDPAAPNVPAAAFDKIKLVSADGSQLVKGIDSFLKVPNGGVLPNDPTASVTPGALEQSNVNTAATLVDMIEAQRSFEMRARVIQTASELDESSSSLLTMR